MSHTNVVASSATCGLLTYGGVIAGIAALVGATLMPTIGVVGGIALVGFQTLLTLPLNIGLFKFTSNVKAQNPHNPAINSAAACIALILSVGFFFVGYAASHAICNSISSLPKFSYMEAIRFGGLWIGVFSGITAGVSCLGASSIVTSAISGSSPSAPPGFVTPPTILVPPLSGRMPPPPSLGSTWTQPPSSSGASYSPPTSLLPPPSGRMPPPSSLGSTWTQPPSSSGASYSPPTSLLPPPSGRIAPPPGFPAWTELPASSGASYSPRTTQTSPSLAHVASVPLLEDHNF